jgi:RNA polymerase sigma-70 factor (ECF subfamily)
MARPERPTPSDAELNSLTAQLLPHREMFLAFARKRVADPELAADAVQDSLLKAIKSAGQLRDGESVVPWFYRILRRTILDLYRRRDVRQRVLVEMPEDFEAAAAEEQKTDVCKCLRALLPTLKPEYAQVIEAVDLGEGSLESVAAKLGVARNNLKVRLHRARKQLRDRLVESCRVCATHGCFDCHCRPCDDLAASGKK